MKLAICIAFVLVSSCSALLGIIGTEQSVEVIGKLICNGKPADDIKVKLYDKEMILDSKLGEAHTNKEGFFKVSGHKRELSTLDPKVNIYHRCNHDGICDRKFSISIPENFITDGEKPTKTFDIGTINLADQFKGETTDCIN